jgi:hypothetical protein
LRLIERPAQLAPFTCPVKSTEHGNADAIPLHEFLVMTDFDDLQME